MNPILFSPVCMGVCITLAVLFLMAQGRKVMLRACVALSVPAFLGGIGLYTVAYLPESVTLSDGLTAVLRGLFSTGRMFLVNDDYGFVVENAAKEWLVQSSAFRLAFWLCHVLALIVAVSAVMGIFGAQLINTLRRRLRFYESCTILCGGGDEALILGENILTRDGALKGPDRRRLVVFLVPELTDALQDAASGMGAVALEWGGGDFGAALCRAGLKASRRRITRCRVVLMPGSDAVAMDQLAALWREAGRLNIPEDWLSIHLLSESAWVRRYAYESQPRRWPLHVAGENELAARLMILRQPPALAVPFENGVARRDFVVLLVGFGALGQQALRRLVKNGQFVGSAMRAIVVDADGETRAGAFRREHPELERCCALEIHALSPQSDEFYALLEGLAPDLCYLVAATEDEGLNLELGQVVTRHFERRGLTPPRMALALASAAGDAGQRAGTVFFSQREALYSEAVLIHEETDAMAMAVNLVYAGGADGDGWPLWHGLSPMKQESSRATADFIPSMLHMAGISEADALSRDALTDNPELAEILARTEHGRWNAFHLASGYSLMALDEMAARFGALREAGEDAAQCRNDTAALRHACLVAWEDLQQVSDAFNALLADAGLEGVRDFAGDDRTIVRGIPQFLRRREALIKRRPRS